MTMNCGRNNVIKSYCNVVNKHNESVCVCVTELKSLFISSRDIRVCYDAIREFCVVFISTKQFFYLLNFIYLSID